MAQVVKITVKEFLTTTGDIKHGTVVELERNINNGKLSVNVNNRTRYKAQATINLSLPVFVLVEDENYDEACFVNAAEFETMGSIAV